MVESKDARIAVVVKCWPRLSETFIAQEMAGLEARGLKLVIYSLRLPTDPGFTHLDAEGRARMVDISDKHETERVAIAGARIVMRPETLERIRSGDVAKGDVLAVARLAGIMAAKRTAELIPLCHPLALTSVKVDLECVSERSAVEITATCKLRGRTGVEMEALTAASVAALTVYDMCKAVDRGMVVTDLRLLRKWGGKSGNWEAER